MMTERHARRMPARQTVLVLAILAIAAGTGVSPSLTALAQGGAGRRTADEPLAALRDAFAAPPDDARIMMRWWWFGPAVTRAGLERELRQMKAGGIGGVEIQPVYPLALDDDATGIVTHPFLSDAFLDDVAVCREDGAGPRPARRSDAGQRMAVRGAAGEDRRRRRASCASSASIVPPGAARVAVPDIRGGERLIAAFLSPRAPADSRRRACARCATSRTACCTWATARPTAARCCSSSAAAPG